MRSIYKTVLTTLILLSASALYAQTSSFDVRFTGGLNLSSLSFENNDIPGNRIKPGMNVGFLGTYTTQGGVFLQSGLIFTTKGAKIKGEIPLGFSSGILYPGEKPVLTSRLMYLQVPIQVGGNISLSPDTKLFAKAGPYLAYGVGGKTRLEGHIIYGDAIDTQPLEEPTFGDRGLRKFDYGLGAGLGIDLGEVILEVNYELGLKDIAPVETRYIPFYDSSYKNRNLFLSISFKL